MTERPFDVKEVKIQKRIVMQMVLNALGYLRETYMKQGEPGRRTEEIRGQVVKEENTKDPNILQILFICNMVHMFMLLHVLSIDSAMTWDL